MTGSFALIAHAFAGNVDWRVGGVFGVAGMVGAYVGGILAGFVPEHVLPLGCLQVQVLYSW